MAVVNLRLLTNHPNLPIGVYNNPNGYSVYAEDWQALRDTLQGSKYGIATLSVAALTTLTVGTTAAITGATTVGGTLGVTGAATFTSTGTFGGAVAVTGNITVSGTVDGVDVSTHDHSGGAGGQIVTAGIADGAVTFVKLAAAGIAAAAASLDSSHVVRGDVVADVKASLGNQTNGLGWLPVNAIFLVSRTLTGATANSVINPWTGAEGLLYVLYGTTAMNPPVLRFVGGFGNDTGVAIAYVSLPAGISSGTLTYKLHYVSTTVSAAQSYTMTHGYRLLPAGAGVNFGVAADDVTWPADYATSTLTLDDTTVANVRLTATSAAITTTGSTMVAIGLQKPTGATSGANFYLIGISLHWTPSYTL